MRAIGGQIKGVFLALSGAPETETNLRFFANFYIPQVISPATFWLRRGVFGRDVNEKTKEAPDQWEFAKTGANALRLVRR